MDLSFLPFGNEIAAYLTAFIQTPLFAALWQGALALVALLIVLSILRGFWRRRYQTGVAFRKTVLLVAVPKEQAEKGESGLQEKSLSQIQEKIAVMENVFAAVGGLKAERGFQAWLLGRQDSVSFEIVAKDGLVSFYVAVPPRLKDFIVQQIQAQFPHAQVEEVPDYNIFRATGEIAGTRLAFRRESYLPLRSYKKMDTDPLNALTNSLAKVEKTDGAAIQVLVRSAKREWRLGGAAYVKAIKEGRKPGSKEKGPASVLSMAAEMTVAGPGSKDEGMKKDYRMSPIEEETAKTVDEKLSQFGLDVVIRIVASGKTRDAAQLYVDNLANAFSQFDIPQYGNSLTRRSDAPARLINDFIYRHFAEQGQTVLTGQELASIFHLPLSSTETPNIRWLLARRVAPPSNLPTEGLYVGQVEYHGATSKVFLKKEDRFRHMYLIGKSGSGKSEMIANMAVQDVRNGDGVAVIDPHGDLVETILASVPKERADDVIVFDPSDMERPMGLNMIESPAPEMTDFVVGEMIAIFYKLFPPEYLGPMFEHSMRNFMLTLAADPGDPGTLIEIPRLITDPEYQKKWVAKVKDPVVRSYWENEVARTSESQKSEMFGYLISKVGRFVENTMMRNIIGQQRSALDFRDVMDNRKILLVNLSKGKIGDLNANLLGLIIVSKLQMAVMRRADMQKAERKDFFLYIDEFQNFITPSIATILSEARKYRISLTVAHQYMAQLAPKGDTEIRDAVLGNVGTMLIGRIGIEDADVLSKEFAPVFSPMDLVNVEAFTWNTKMLVDNTAARPFTLSGPPPLKGDLRMATALKQLSRLKYGRDRLLVEDEIMERAQFGATRSAPAAK